ncbi:MAG: hypothetical protein ACOYD5_11950 [Negativicutes bacterium]
MIFLQYTGHPFVDVGIAVLESYLKKCCTEFTEQDLSKAAEWLKDVYKRKDFKGYLTIHFPNSGWCNANIKEDTKAEYIKKVLKSYGDPPLSSKRSCAFCNNPAQFLADRQHIPLLTGTTVLVTAPNGVAGLPVCGYCLMAIQFYPLGTIKVNGRPLFWWTTDTDMTFELINNTVQEVRKSLATSQEKVVNFKWPFTRLLSQAREILDVYDAKSLQAKKETPLPDCIGYHVTNYGSEPDYDQYLIPRELLQFWRHVRVAAKDVREAHHYVETSSWIIPKPKKKGAKSQGTSGVDSEGIGFLRNSYYEALGKAFQERNWQTIIGRRIIGFFLHTKEENYHWNNYQLCELFLGKVGGMEKQRLDIVKKIADDIVDHLILGNNEPKWLDNLYNREIKPNEFMRYLVKVQRKLAVLGQPINLDDILTMFDISSSDDPGLKDAYLIRQLFLIRMFERIGARNRDLLKSINDEKNENEEVM